MTKVTLTSAGDDFRAFVRNATGKKIQFGVRRRKHGPDWISVDLYDTSELIDHNWDIHDLPLEDESVDAYSCRAVLEHVEEPMLAIYEMFRTLKVGGTIFVGVPFIHPVHAAPNDFLRWTVAGIRRWMSDFEEVTAGYSAGCEYEARKFYDIFHKEKNVSSPKTARNQMIEYIQSFEEKHGISNVIYRAVHFSGVKTKKAMRPAKENYLLDIKEMMKAEKQAASPL